MERVTAVQRWSRETKMFSSAGAALLASFPLSAEAVFFPAWGFGKLASRVASADENTFVSQGDPAGHVIFCFT